MNNAQLLLLTDWFRRARESQEVHYESEKYYKFRHYLLGIPASIASVGVGTSIFVVLEADSSGSLKIVLSLVSVLSAILVALNTFMNSAQLAEKHRSSASAYSAIRRKLERMKTANKNDDDLFERELDLIETDFNTLASNSPNPPDSVSEKTIKRLKSKEHNRIFQIRAKN